jgi:hypothetical protein
VFGRLKRATEARKTRTYSRTAFLSPQLVYRYALDAFAKNCMRYNTEYLFGANVVGGNGFTEKFLSVREAL